MEAQSTGQAPLVSGEKDEEARLEREMAAVSQMQSQQQIPPAMAGAGPLSGVPMYAAPPSGSLVVSVQPSLPRELWPHAFIHLSAFLTGVLGFFNIFTLFTTIPATVFSVISYSQSKKGKYSAAKSSSKLTVMFLVMAVSIFGVCWLNGWVFTVGLYLSSFGTYS